MVGKVAAWLLWLGATWSALWLGYQKWQALAYHTRDFAYYAQVAAKLLDPASAGQLSINPRGVNLLGMAGVEGVRGLHHAIHLEPIKYLAALCYALADSPVPLFALYAALYFAPLLYGAWIMKPPTRLDGLFMAFLALLYCLHPAVPFAVTYDLRPFMLLGPMLLIAGLALTYQRPTWESLLTFNALFLVREEALVLGGALLLYAAALAQQGRGSWGLVRGLAASWLAWAGVWVGYLVWAGYGWEAEAVAAGEGVGTSGLALLPLGVAVAWGAGLAYGWWRGRLVLPLLAYSTLFLPLGWQFYRAAAGESPQDLFYELVYGPRLSLYLSALLLGALIAWQTSRARWPRQLMVGALGGALLLLVPLHAGPEESLRDLRHDLAEWRQEVGPVWAARAATDRHQSAILTDQHTFQAFYDYEQLYEYERLPWYVMPTAERGYPANAATLHALLAREIDWIVIQQRNQPEVWAIMQAAGVTGRARVVAQTERVIVYQLAPPGEPRSSRTLLRPAPLAPRLILAR